MTFGRTCTFRGAGLEIKHAGPADARISFNVKRDRSRDPDSASVTVWGLDRTIRSKLSSAGRSYTELFAGYADGGESRIFSGVILNVTHARDGAGYATTFDLGDEAEQRAALRRIHRVFPVGMTFLAVLQELAKATGFASQNLELATSEARIAGSAELQRPWLASGSAVGEFSHFASSLGFQWTIQDQKILLLGLGQSALGAGPLLSAQTGLEGTPAVSPDGTISLACRLVRDLFPGRPFRVESEEVNGDFVAAATEHIGDTHNAPWSIVVDGEPFETSIRKGLIVDGA